METRQIANEEADIILGYDENHFRDGKAKEIAPAKLSRSISAFANTAGGELFVGVTENGDGTRAWNGFENVGVGMLSAREALFLIVADDPGTASRSHLDERNSSVVESADTYANEIGRFAARQSCDQVPRPLGSELAVRTMNVFMPEEPLCKR